MQGREGAFSKWCELLIVVTIAFGLLIWSSLSAVARDAIEPVFSDASLWGMVFYELLVLAILPPVLWFRDGGRSRWGCSGNYATWRRDSACWRCVCCSPIH